MERFGTLTFGTKKELHKFLIVNKDKLIAHKKATIKKADCPVIISPTLVFDPIKVEAIKANNGVIPDIPNLESLDVVAVINTTNFFDNHCDVHIPGLWGRSLNNNKMIMHVNGHVMNWENIIADGDELKAYVKTFKWPELGLSYQGNTEALIFESKILRKRNEFMLNQYANKWVRNHSVGMIYVKMGFAMNDEDYPNEHEMWNKYYPEIANKEDAEERGFFWPVLEAKLIEGSAVPIGSNTATPTLEIGKGDPSKDTHDTESDPDKSTQIDYKFLLSNLTKSN